MEIMMLIGKVFLTVFGVISVYAHCKQAFTEIEDFME
jgi:hypothetical protein|uniref:SMALL S PROTEIN-BINDING PROTEIN, PRION REGULATORY DOMAIN.3A n=1 Tax=Siphoviridae sp. ctWKa2 TaxID=2825537 RepID=A0A8S5PGE7_9CAUD|nr:MAG TPA: SMALL S PROTEIN-BINDING PROTEIN, PRION REGULATORY DOMAIN.3A [Siphoviridae sp. ctWKa2]